MNYTKDFLSDKYDIGEFSYGIPVVHDLRGDTNLKIGKFCSIASNVQIFLGMNHRIEWISTYPFGADETIWSDDDIERHKNSGGSTKGDITIGNDVWIGMDAVILSGITIGDGAVIAAKAVVSRDVLPYAVVAGNPARQKRMRFDDKTIKKLLEIKWWNWPLEKIKANTSFLCCDNAARFIGAHKSSMGN